MKGNNLEQKQTQISIVLHDKRIHSNKKSQNKINQTNRFLHIDETFSSFVGLKKLKKIMKQIYATKQINLKREEIGLVSNNQVLHMLFKGNPGTGKTTIARKLAAFYLEINLLSKGHFIEAERADLVGEYIGQTAQKTRSLIQKAQGGILFIDEAYSLARGGEKDFGKEAIDTLVTHMENHHEDFVLILAGYPHEMEQFLALNPGLKSRFPFILDFEDFSVEQLIKIANQMAASREYELSTEAEDKLRHHLIKKSQTNNHTFANGRYIRNVIEGSIRKQAMRLIGKDPITTNELIRLNPLDLQLNLED